jgi:3-hydroxyisobutyrate dehydrogenase-like beta-hydroxyacid dehydrogenase
VPQVGIIGLGLLGSAIAARLLAAGNEVVGFDVSQDCRESLAAAGGQIAKSPEEVAQQCNVVLLSLPDSTVVASVLKQLDSQLRPGLRIVDTSTGEPLETVAIAAALAARGIEYLDATVLGSSVQTRAGDVVVMVGGSAEGFAASRELLSCFAREVFHVGPAGAGSRMKLVVNLVLGLNRAVLAEGLTLAKALELDLPMALAVLQSGAASSAVMESKGAKMLSGDFSPQARLSQHLKDVRLMLGAAERTGTQLPLSEVHRRLLERAEAAGFGDADNSAVLRAFDR